MRRISAFFWIAIILGAIGCTRRYEKSSQSFSILERIAHERSSDIEMEDFIDSLMLRMTLSEKIGQMTQLDESYFKLKSRYTKIPIQSLDTSVFAQVIREYQVGSIVTSGSKKASEWVDYLTKIQEINLTYSNNKIPVIFGIDHVHGANYIDEGTVFPHQMNIAATFNPQFAENMGFYTSLEASHIGHQWDYAPLLGVGRKPNWPGLYETFGEDSHLATVMGPAYINGVQKAAVDSWRMAACAKYFIGNSVPNTGWEGTPADITAQNFYEIFVPPFQAAIDSGVMSVMVGSGEINGVPILGSYEHLTEKLRDDFGFSGVTIAHNADIAKLKSEHQITENTRESVFVAVMAGIDVSIVSNDINFCDNLLGLVKEGRIAEDRINLSVKRILRMKYLLGLFDQPFPTDEYLYLIGSGEAEYAAVNAAGESIVLMKNERRLLPLSKPGRLVVTGLNADVKSGLFGGRSYTEQGNDESMYPDSINTVLDAIKEEFENTRVIKSTPNALPYNARLADVIIIVTGENAYADALGNIDDMNLYQEELDLIQKAVSTGKPVVLVLLEGRPRIIGELYDACQAVLFAGLPGKFGGQAISGVLSGRINPSAKMPITYPYKTGHMIPYNHKNSIKMQLDSGNQEISRYTIGEFGTGESYSRFEYSDLQLSDTIIYPGSRITASIKIKNNGYREGKEVVLWYISDEIASITRPVRQLKYFEKKFLLPGEVKEYRFTIDPYKHLSFPDQNNILNLEPGYFTITAGNLSKQILLLEED